MFSALSPPPPLPFPLTNSAQTLYARLPSSIAEAAREYVAATRTLWDRDTEEARATARQRRVVLGALLNEMIAALDKKDWRKSKSADDSAAAARPAAQLSRSDGMALSSSAPPTLLGLHSLVARSDDTAALERMLSVATAGQVDQRDSNKRTPLMIAAARGKVELLKVLLRSGANVNALDGLGCSSLLIAASKGHFDACALLLQTPGIDAQRSEAIAKPLDYLVKYDPKTPQQRAVFVAMWDAGYSVNMAFARQQGDAVLAIACGNENAAFVDLILKRPGVSVNACNKFGETALHKCARVGNAELIRKLLAAGADVDVEGSAGKPLQVLARTCPSRLQVQALLLSKQQQRSAPAPQPPPRMADTLRRLGAKSSAGGGAGAPMDAFELLNALLAEGEALASPRSLSPRAAAATASPRELQRAMSSDGVGAQPRKADALCSECRKAPGKTWVQLKSRGEKDKRAVCGACFDALKAGTSAPSSATTAGRFVPPLALEKPVEKPLPPGKHRVVAASASPMLRVEEPDSSATPFAPMLEDAFEPYRLQVREWRQGAPALSRACCSSSTSRRWFLRVPSCRLSLCLLSLPRRAFTRPLHLTRVATGCTMPRRTWWLRAKAKRCARRCAPVRQARATACASDSAHRFERNVVSRIVGLVHI